MLYRTLHLQSSNCFRLQYWLGGKWQAVHNSGLVAKTKSLCGTSNDGSDVDDVDDDDDDDDDSNRNKVSE